MDDARTSRSGPVPPALLTPALRAVLGVLGAGSFGTGILAVFVTKNGTGTGVLLAIGGVLLVFALLGNRVESFEVGGANLRLRAAAADRYRLADASELAGDDDTAAALREEARSLMRVAGPLADAYVSVRGSMRSGPERTRVMGNLVDRARRMAAEESFEPSQVRDWLRGGTDGERITALAMMQVRPELRDLDGVLDTVLRPRSPFEQYHALLVVSRMVETLDTAPLRRVVEVLDSEQALPRSVLRRGADRRLLADDILERARHRIASGAPGPAMP